MRSSLPIAIVPGLVAAILGGTLATAHPARAGLGSCGQPFSNGLQPVAADSLMILHASVGLAGCGTGLDDCVCDVNGDSALTATDALLNLQAAIGQPVTLDCDCDAPADPEWITRMSGTDAQLNGIVWTGTRFIVVGDDEPVLRSDDSITWTATDPGLFSPQGANAVVWSGTTAIAVENWIYRSTDGAQWEIVHTGFDEMRDVAWSASLSAYVAVGEDGAILSAAGAQAEQWVVEDSGVSNWLNAVAWGSDRFVAVGDGGTLLTSSDGSAWTSVSTPTTSSLYGVTWSGTTFVAVGIGTVLTSTDGTTWQLVDYTPPDVLDDIVWSDELSLFVTIGWNGAIITSPDAENWTDRTIPDTFLALNDIVWSGSEFVVVGDRGEIARSTDGSEWTTVHSGADWYNVIWDGAQFVAVGATGKLLTSSDGIDWLYGYTGDAWDHLFDLAPSDTTYAAGGQTYLLSSPDLTSWPTKQWLGATSSCRGVVWDGQQFVAVCTSGVIYRSDDGTDWNWQVLNATSDLYDIVWTGGQYVAVGHDGDIVTSADAEQWTSRSSATTSRLRSIAWSGSEYVAVGDNATVLRSPDGATWTTQDADTTRSLHAAAWTGTDFVVVGAAGTILRSPTGEVWTGTTHTFETLRGVAWSGSRLVVVGDRATVATLD